MKDTIELIEDIRKFNSDLQSAENSLKREQKKYEQELAALDQLFQCEQEKINNQRDRQITLVKQKYNKIIAEYTALSQKMDQNSGMLKMLCSPGLKQTYTPDPENVSQDEINLLLERINEKGFIVWLKRIFHLDGYGSRKDMADQAYQKILDICAFCDQTISAARTACEHETADLITEARRNIASEKANCEQSRKEQEKKRNNRIALNAAAREQYRNRQIELSSRIHCMQTEETAFYGQWGEYTAPASMPERLKLLDFSTVLDDIDGNSNLTAIPAWIDLFQSNLIILTSSRSAQHGRNYDLFMHQILARMLKTIPPENCVYTVFDSVRKGASLGRLIDVTNIGDTNLKFELFTNEKSSDRSPSCDERREYLCNRPAVINKMMAGRSASLFTFNRSQKTFSAPFTWIVDFDFPDNPSEQLKNQIRNLFVNASAAGCSFLISTGAQGVEQLKALASKTSISKPIVVEFDIGTCHYQGSDFLIDVDGGPEPDQISNFVACLKQYYDSGQNLDNTLLSVFGRKEIPRMSRSDRLSIPMALDHRGNLIPLELGGIGSVHGFISGASNSGKSTLLHTIILSACLCYSPEDLEIWLADYKSLEFQLYNQFPPPHVKLIGISKTVDFTRSFLDRIEAEARRRTTLMNHFYENKIEDYWKHKGESDYEDLPLILVIVDEFHEMSQFVADDPIYKTKLENTLREYRAQGFICLLADQAFSTGISALTEPAKMQLGLRIAMRNETSISEIKSTLAVDSGMYSEKMLKSMRIMSQGDFFMKTNILDENGSIIDAELRKFRALHAQKKDIFSIGQALQNIYPQFTGEGPIYVNTSAAAFWSAEAARKLDQLEPLKAGVLRLYLGKTATICPCFGLDLKRQPDQNLSVVGGTIAQRWAVLKAAIQSCILKNYRLILFVEESSDLAADYQEQILELCRQVPDLRYAGTIAQWCSELSQIETDLKQKCDFQNTVCMFIGLETAYSEFTRLPDKEHASPLASHAIWKYGTPVETEGAEAPCSTQDEFDAFPVIQQMFASGSKLGLRCIVEISVYRVMQKLPDILDMCRHRIAFDMSSDDCMMYLGNSRLQKALGTSAIYSDGGSSIKKLIPYSLNKEDAQ